LRNLRTLDWIAFLAATIQKTIKPDNPNHKTYKTQNAYPSHRFLHHSASRDSLAAAQASVNVSYKINFGVSLGQPTLRVDRKSTAQFIQN
jgi:hypothetical protein